MAARRAALGDLSNVGADAAAQGGVKWDPPPNVRVTRGMRQRALAAEQASAQQPSAVDSVAGEISNEHQFKAVALYTFESQNADELTVTENEQVTVLLGKSN